MTDLVVIGAGLSGLMAAHAAASRGMSAKVIAKGLGAMHWTAGTIDLLGYAAGGDAQPIRRPFDALANLASRQPEHPYALLGIDAIRASLTAFVELAAASGLPYGGAQTDDENLLLPSPVGAARPTLLAPHAQLAGDLSRDEPVLIVGFHGLRDFYPTLIAENLRKQGVTARAHQAPFSLLTDRTDSNTIQLAHELDDAARRVRLMEALRPHIQPGERVGLPAILGIDEHAVALAELEAGLGAPVFEIPTLPPSVPGIRLHRALQRSLAELGVRIEAGMDVIDAETVPATNGNPPRIKWVASETSARPLKHRAARFVLATGGILGGGFNSDHTGRVWETVFDLPLTVPQARSQWFHPRFLDETGHPIFHGGVAVDDALQPLDQQGRLCYANLHAAGTVLAGLDPIVARSLEGVAIASGVAAGKAVAQLRD